MSSNSLCNNWMCVCVGVDVYGADMPVPKLVCVGWYSLDVLFTSSTICHLCMISVDRYMTLTYPLRYGHAKKKKHTIIWQPPWVSCSHEYMCLCRHAVRTGSCRRAVMPCGWEGNRRSGVRRRSWVDSSQFRTKTTTMGKLFT